MEMHLKYDISLACKVIVKEHLEKLGIPYLLTENGTVEFKCVVPSDKSQKLEAALKRYGIELIDTTRSILVQQIKEAIVDVIYHNNKPSSIKLSDYLADRLNLSYSYLSRIFRDETGTSIENYMIFHRIERVKQLIIYNQFTITEIAWKLHFSSVAHLSNQFKKITGISPTLYQQWIRKNNRKKHLKVFSTTFNTQGKMNSFNSATV